MNPKQALRDALLAVALPTLVLSSGLWYWIGTAEELPFYIGFFVVPTVLLLPLVYRKYRRGPHPPSAKQQGLAGVLFVITGAGYAVDAFLTHGDKWRILLRFSIALGWLAVGALQLYHAHTMQAAHAKSELQSAD
jgi:hypothetical protein